MPRREKLQEIELHNRNGILCLSAGTETYRATFEGSPDCIKVVKVFNDFMDFTTVYSFAEHS